MVDCRSVGGGGGALTVSSLFKLLVVVVVVGAFPKRSLKPTCFFISSSKSENISLDAVDCCGIGDPASFEIRNRDEDEGDCN